MSRVMLAARRASRRGVSLLELILALALAVMVMALIAGAIDLHTNMTMNGRVQVEQAQLARSLMNQIAGDLRSIVTHNKQDFSSVPGVADLAGGLGLGTGDGTGGTGNGAGTGGTGNGGTGNGGTGNGGTGNGGTGNNGTAGSGIGGSGAGSGIGTGGGSGSGNSSRSGNGTSGGSGQGAGSGTGSGSGSGTGSSGGTGTGSGASGTATGTSSELEEDMAGLIGVAGAIEIDVSRIPRVDQYEGMMNQGSVNSVDIPSDLKTVAYYVGVMPAGNPGALSTDTATGGLIRRSVDRAVTRFGGSDIDSAAELLATEVVALQFNYFDGTAWVAEWDSSSSGALPTAVEVLITISTPVTRGLVQQATAALTGEQTPTHIETTYRQVIHLPLAQPADSTTTTE